MSIGVIGAGAFGTSLAVALAQHGNDVMLWARKETERLQADRENAKYLPNIGFPESLNVTAELAHLNNCQAILLVVPAQQTQGFLENHRLPDVPIVLCAKGINLATGALQSQIAAKHTVKPLSVLTGPSFAIDIASGLPTALALACEDAETGAALQQLLSTPRLRLYLSDDPTGAQLGGALKNVIALACGMTIGAGLGESARAAILTRGFAEMQRIGIAMGAQPETLQGLSGFGDLTLTCSSEKSRNYAMGLAIGQGKAPEPGITVEGVATAKAITRFTDVKTPIADAVCAIIDQKISLTQAIESLLSRPLTQE